MSERIPSHEYTNEVPLSRRELDYSIDALSSSDLSVITGARIETMLLDLEENPAKAGESFAERKDEIEAALEIVNTTKPDDEKGLGVYGVIDERMKLMKNAIEKDPSNAKLWEQRLAALELASGIFSEVYDEPTNKLQAKNLRADIDEKLYQEHQDVINSDIRHDHNNRVRENDKRRKLLEQIKLVQGTHTRH